MGKKNLRLGILRILFKLLSRKRFMCSFENLRLNTLYKFDHG